MINRLSRTNTENYISATVIDFSCIENIYASSIMKNDLDDNIQNNNLHNLYNKEEFHVNQSSSKQKRSLSMPYQECQPNQDASKLFLKSSESNPKNKSNAKFANEFDVETLINHEFYDFNENSINIWPQEIKKLVLEKMNFDYTKYGSFIQPTNIPLVFKCTKELKIQFTESYKNGEIIIQNYSSCLPAHVLNPPPKSFVIDACAAPGNKTSQLASIMGNTGKIFAYEKNHDRFQTLNTMLAKHGVTNTETFCKDFTEAHIDNTVEYILIDPSCSGSGIHNFTKKDDERLKKLSFFQKKILLHAMKFKNAKKIVYSTCSVYEEENEMVVQSVLEENTNFTTKRIELDNVSRGASGYSFSNDVIRMEIDKNNGSQGFFVALFTQKEH
ncbi:hypothetical protein EDEG_03090 [Edhazardia aedis USNM 41457]|uniref:SAM-dependent MTase RsmB/NOP-type domain-containing protein n=1 Tax=Edhazardia aedis (strain USNM 41457) TaxID=1003232 RepID=J9D4M8_EDHAE|nr:hypothetical protein EDEG_03090 [Edhazardia aedis USNM 41457]|eukprot:EJW02504.1 hypothetical protein EDEG_03090 [Edhazardia aedis USNM 41457]